MRRLVLAAAAALVSWPVLAQQGSVLRIGMAEDTDMLDPTLSRTYVGRIVFAGLCDKLVDINEKLEIVPQLATGYEWPDSKTLVLHLRQGVKFQDGTRDGRGGGEIQPGPPPDHGGQQRGAARSRSMDHVEVVDPSTVTDRAEDAARRSWPSSPTARA